MAITERAKKLIQELLDASFAYEMDASSANYRDVTRTETALYAYIAELESKVNQS